MLCVGLTLNKPVGLKHAAPQKTAPPKSEQTVAREKGSDCPAHLSIPRDTRWGEGKIRVRSLFLTWAMSWKMQEGNWLGAYRMSLVGNEQKFQERVKNALSEALREMPPIGVW